MMPQAVTVGVDLGFGYVKVAGEAFRCSFPSLVTEPGAASDAVGLLEWEGHRLLVGEGAAEEESPRYAADDEKVTRPEEICKYLAALALAADRYDTARFRVVTGLPPAHYQRPHQKQQMVDNLSGPFVFTYSGQRYALLVEDVQVDPQAGAAFHDYLLLDDGSINPANQDLVETPLRSITVDPGFRTTDIYLADGRKAALKGRSILTVDKGVWTALEEVKRVLSQQYGISLEPQDIERLISSRQQLRVSGQPVPLQELLHAAAVPIAKSIVTAVKRHCGDTKLWDVLLPSGGGWHLLGEALSAELAVPVRSNKRPEFANAAGFFKRATERR